MVVLVHSVTHRRFILKCDICKIVRTNLQERYFATILKVFEQILFRDFGSDVAHDDRVVGLVVVRSIGLQHKQPFAAIVLLVPQHDDVAIRFVGYP